MRYALAMLALIATVSAQPAFAKRCAQPMYRLAAVQPRAESNPPRTDRQPCTILQNWTPERPGSTART